MLADPSAQYAAAKTKQGFHEAPVLDIGYIQPDFKKAPFDDVLVRQAFSLALDRDSIANKVLAGIDVPTYHIVPKGMPGYNDSLTGPNGATSLSGDPTQATSLMQAYAKDKCGGHSADHALTRHASWTRPAATRLHPGRCPG